MVRPLELWRGDDGIGDEIVDEVGAHGPRKAHIQHLNRGGTKREDLVASALRVTVEIDEDMYAIGGDTGGDGDDVEMRHL